MTSFNDVLYGGASENVSITIYWSKAFAAESAFLRPLPVNKKLFCHARLEHRQGIWIWR